MSCNSIIDFPSNASHLLPHSYSQISNMYNLEGCCSLYEQPPLDSFFFGVISSCISQFSTFFCSEATYLENVYCSFQVLGLNRMGPVYFGEASPWKTETTSINYLFLSDTKMYRHLQMMRCQSKVMITISICRIFSTILSPFSMQGYSSINTNFQLSQNLIFSITIQMYSKLGSKSVDGQWSDLFRDIINGEIDISYDCIIKTVERSEDLCFTYDIMMVS